MSIRRGDIYWIEQSKYRPTVGSVQKPGRPGIVVSNDANNTCSLTLEIVYLTGKPKKCLPTHCAINSSPRPSIALCEQIQTISDEQLRDYIGHCTDEEMEEIDRCIAISLGLPEPNSDEDEEPIFYTNEERENYLEIIKQLDKKLAVANARAELFQEMYNGLLERITA